ncbi:hypothetical protein M951_chr1167 (nucleomorph) [Lotharella oceanica]|uniref:Uncharacterized protein n=1 Tax=Lotharella oceanica TaxID=641309 RepID=A0A060D6P3_9EUKA|nr:hypothetical protein M951_chr1167 [Lotharella oceanica]
MYSNFLFMSIGWFLIFIFETLKYYFSISKLNRLNVFIKSRGSVIRFVICF